MNVTAVIKASKRSVHFPNRYTVKVGGVSLLDSIVARLRQSQIVHNIVLSTTLEDVDDNLVEAAKKLDIRVHRGSYEDALGRLKGAAQLGQADVIVKVWGHYPLVDASEMDRLLTRFQAEGVQYGYNEHYDGIILGLGVEVFSYELLEKSSREITSAVQRRIGTNIFKDLLDSAQMLVVSYPHPRPNYRVTLAVPNDVLMINQIIEECGQLNYEGILRYLDKNPIIVKYAQQNISGPGEAGIEKILLFPRKVASLNHPSGGGVDFSYPVSVELSLTNRCNLGCKWCSDSNLRSRSMVDFDFEVLKTFLDDLAEHGTGGIVLEGGGEPTLYPKFNEAVRYAKGLGMNLGLISNGTVIPDDDCLMHFDWIRISLDAANPQQFTQGKGADFFDTVLSNLQHIASRKHLNGLTVGVGYVLTNLNEAHLEKLVFNLRRIDIDYIQFRPVIDHPEFMPANMDLEYLAKYSTSQFKVNIHNLKENVIAGNHSLPCRAHSLATVVNANGDVYLCGRLNKYEWLAPIGNVHHQSFHALWHGPERIKQARMVLDSEFCRQWCPECRLTKYNMLLDTTARIKTKNFI